MRHTPSQHFWGKPCSYVGVGCAFENICHQYFHEPFPEGLRKDGYLSLNNCDKYIRKYLSVVKKQYLKKPERMTLKDFLSENTEKCLVCVQGHFLYVSGEDYWSYFKNEFDPVICIWYLDPKHS